MQKTVLHRALILSSLLLTLTACQGSATPQDVALAELAAQATQYDGRTVRTRGRVRSFDSPRHYWLEDRWGNRVGLLPPEQAAPHLDREISVRGRFEYNPQRRGRYISLDAVEPYDAAR